VKMLLVALLFSYVSAVSYAIPNDCTNCCDHWTYDEQDDWNQINCFKTKTGPGSNVQIPNYCKTGVNQSPENIVDWVVDWNLPELTFVDYGPNPSMTIVNNGHTIQATYTNGYYNNDRHKTFFQIAQFHFHTHSEESVRGVGDVASLHLVHAQNPAPSSDTMGLSVLGILFIIGPDDNNVIQPIIDALVDIPMTGNTTTRPFGGFGRAFADMKGSGTNDYWNFPGSLTTPPCTENLDWTVLATPWTMSRRQLTALNDALVADTASATPGTSNYRKVQRNLTSVSYRPASFAASLVVPLCVFLGAICPAFL